MKLLRFSASEAVVIIHDMWEEETWVEEITQSSSSDSDDDK